MALEVGGIEVDGPEVAVREAFGLVEKCGESGSPLLPPSLTAKARSSARTPRPPQGTCQLPKSCVSRVTAASSDVSRCASVWRDPAPQNTASDVSIESTPQR